MIELALNILAFGFLAWLGLHVLQFLWMIVVGCWVVLTGPVK